MDQAVVVAGHWIWKTRSKAGVPMTFWDSTDSRAFDPTVASPEELLEDWPSAMKAMSPEQAIERIVCMLARDRNSARERGKRDCNGFLQTEGWFEKDSCHMVEEFNRVPSKGNYSSFSNANGAWKITSIYPIDGRRVIAVSFSPHLLDDGTPDWVPDWTKSDRYRHFISIDSEDVVTVVLEGQYEVCRFYPYAKDGQAMNMAGQLKQALELSKRWNIPLLCGGKLCWVRWNDDREVRIVAQSPRVDTTLPGWTFERDRVLLDLGKNGIGSPSVWYYMARHQDEIDLGWRERVLSRKGPHLMWPEISP